MTVKAPITKITKSQLKKLINEELQKFLKEQDEQQMFMTKNRTTTDLDTRRTSPSIISPSQEISIFLKDIQTLITEISNFLNSIFGPPNQQTDDDDILIRINSPNTSTQCDSYIEQVEELLSRLESKMADLQKRLNQSNQQSINSFDLLEALTDLIERIVEPSTKQVIDGNIKRTYESIRSKAKARINQMESSLFYKSIDTQRSLPSNLPMTTSGLENTDSNTQIEKSQNINDRSIQMIKSIMELHTALFFLYYLSQE
jgi:Na+/phosphate symporter